MNFIRLIKTIFYLVYIIFVTLFKWIFIVLFIVFVISIFRPNQSTYSNYEFEQKNTIPFNDSTLYLLDENLKISSHEEFTENQRLKIIQQCIAQIPISHYTRVWRDYNQYVYEQTFEIHNGIACEASYNRNHIFVEFENNQKYWQNVYAQVIKFDTTKMQFIFDYFEKIRVEKQLDYIEFAEMIVSFVQSIPYTLIISVSKDEAKNLDGFIRDYILNNKGPVIENIKFGFLSPIEFLYSIRGDCDTRTLALYCILSHFGYDVVILNSQNHSMLGINMPAQGKALKYKGKKYYFWETTGPDWRPGQLPTEYTYGNWYIAVPSVNDF